MFCIYPHQIWRVSRARSEGTHSVFGGHLQLGTSSAFGECRQRVSRAPAAFPRVSEASRVLFLRYPNKVLRQISGGDSDFENGCLRCCMQKSPE